MTVNDIVEEVYDMKNQENVNEYNQYSKILSIAWHESTHRHWVYSIMYVINSKFQDVML